MKGGQGNMREEILYDKIKVSADDKIICLSYYILKKEYNKETNEEEWGIRIEKNDGESFESETISYMTPDFDRLNLIMDILTRNSVTPFSLKEILYEII